MTEAWCRDTFRNSTLKSRRLLKTPGITLQQRSSSRQAGHTAKAAISEQKTLQGFVSAKQEKALKLKRGESSRSTAAPEALPKPLAGKKRALSAGKKAADVAKSRNSATRTGRTRVG